MEREAPTVLLVEDHPDTVAYLARRLQQAGYRPLVARNGEDAWTRVRQEHPDAVVMDVNLPLMDGDEVARRMRQDARMATTPIVFVTAERAERVAELLAMGHALCLEKAIKTKALLAALAELLGAKAPASLPRS